MTRILTLPEATSTLQQVIDELTKRYENPMESIPPDNPAVIDFQSIIDTYKQLQQLLNGEITLKQLMESGSEGNPSLRDPVTYALTRKYIAIAHQMVVEEEKEINANQERELTECYNFVLQTLGYKIPKGRELPGAHFIAVLRTLGKVLNGETIS